MVQMLIECLCLALVPIALLLQVFERARELVPDDLVDRADGDCREGDVGDGVRRRVHRHVHWAGLPLVPHGQDEVRGHHHAHEEEKHPQHSDNTKIIDRVMNCAMLRLPLENASIFLRDDAEG